MRELEDAFKRARQEDFHRENLPPPAPYTFDAVETKADSRLLPDLARQLTSVPEGFQLNPRIGRQLASRRQAFENGAGADWALAETLAFGSLLSEGVPVRLCGQDSVRGAFSHRHAVLHDAETGRSYTPLMELPGSRAAFRSHNSPLSEKAVLAYEYGYSVEMPGSLCLWEAQFGDFANGAQVVIDQFISAGEAKWGQSSALVMLLPHGYEGQGPEHSSARPERFLQLCAGENIQVCCPSTPAQYFHLLRRQAKAPYRKPLVILTPKSLLRHREAVSSRGELAEGGFQFVLDDPAPSGKAKRVILCTGKVYYDLLAHRRENGIGGAALVRLEQWYPFPAAPLAGALKKYLRRKGARLVWCQEEPRNMGAWPFLLPRLQEELGHKPVYAGRPAAASPAAGSFGRHQREQAALVQAAFQD